MTSAVRFNLDQSKILSSDNGFRPVYEKITKRYILIIVNWLNTFSKLLNDKDIYEFIWHVFIVIKLFASQRYTVYVIILQMLLSVLLQESLFQIKLPIK